VLRLMVGLPLVNFARFPQLTRGGPPPAATARNPRCFRALPSASRSVF
jgi:hypothetical protein